jgi:choloylglycine hydrolase
MTAWRSLPLALLLLGAVQPSTAQACSRVLSNSNGQAAVVGRTMDLFMDDQAALVLRPRGLKTGGLMGPALENVKRWQVRYGSVGVLSAGHVLADGLNERGLNVNLLYLSGSNYGPRDPAKPAISNLRLAEYVLDHFASVEEAIAGLAEVQVVSDRFLKREWGLHLSLADRQGHSAVLEFIDGRLVVHQGNQTRVMTNEPPLAWQLNNLKRFKPFGGSLPLPGDVDPASRFVRASTFLSTLPKASSDAEAEGNLYGVMKNIAVPAGAEDYSGSQSEDAWVTLWTVIANLDRGSYAVQLARNPYPVWVELSKLRFDRGGAMHVLPLQSPRLTGDVSGALNRR